MMVRRQPRESNTATASSWSSPWTLTARDEGSSGLWHYRVCHAVSVSVSDNNSGIDGRSGKKNTRMEATMTQEIVIEKEKPRIPIPPPTAPFEDDTHYYLRWNPTGDYDSDDDWWDEAMTLERKDRIKEKKKGKRAEAAESKALYQRYKYHTGRVMKWGNAQWIDRYGGHFISDGRGDADGDADGEKVNHGHPSLRTVIGRLNDLAFDGISMPGIVYHHLQHAVDLRQEFRTRYVLERNKNIGESSIRRKTRRRKKDLATPSISESHSPKNGSGETIGANSIDVGMRVQDDPEKLKNNPETFSTSKAHKHQWILNQLKALLNRFETEPSVATLISDNKDHDGGGGDDDDDGRRTILSSCSSSDSTSAPSPKPADLSSTSESTVEDWDKLFGDDGSYVGIHNTSDPSPDPSDLEIPMSVTIEPSQDEAHNLLDPEKLPHLDCYSGNDETNTSLKRETTPKSIPLQVKTIANLPNNSIGKDHADESQINIDHQQKPRSRIIENQTDSMETIEIRSTSNNAIQSTSSETNREQWLQPKQFVSVWEMTVLEGEEVAVLANANRIHVSTDGISLQNSNPPEDWEMLFEEEAEEDVRNEYPRTNNACASATEGAEIVLDATNLPNASGLVKMNLLPREKSGTENQPPNILLTNPPDDRSHRVSVKLTKPAYKGLTDNLTYDSVWDIFAKERTSNNGVQVTDTNTPISVSSIKIDTSSQPEDDWEALYF